MFIRPARSLTHRTLLLIAIAISVLLAVTTYVTYRVIFGGVEERGRIHLEQYVAERAQREQERHDQLRGNLELVSRTFRETLRQAPAADYRARWESLVVRDSDGAWRSPRGRFDGSRDCTIWAHRDVVLTPELLRRTIVLHDVLETFRPVWIGSFRSLWGATPEMTNIGFDPLIPDWIYNTPADWAQNEVTYFRNSGPERNPERKFTWTFQAQTVQDGYFYTVCLPVYDGDRLIVTIGHDLHIPRLFEESLKTNIAGMTHLMFEVDGRLVAHPAKQGEIFASGGEYSMKNDPALRSLHEAVVSQPGLAVSGYDAMTGQYFAARRLQDPAWYFMATLPRAMLEQEAFQHAHWVLWIGLGSLALVLACLTLILHRTITLPLRRLIGATDRLAAGEPELRLPVEGENEIGRLSAAFNQLASNVAERDHQLRQLNQHLEQRIRERTAELAASESRVRAILENAPEAIVVIDADTGMFADGNDNALRLLGVDRVTLLQRSPFDAQAIVQPDGRPSDTVAREQIAAAMAGETQVFEWLYRPATGPDVLCEVRLSRLPSSTSRLVIGTITDISERKQAERSLMQSLTRERELGEMKSGFVSMVSHEFRTPLGVILSSTEILQHYFDRLGADQRNEHLRTIVRSVRSLSRLVEEVLLLGKVDAGRLKFAPNAIDLPALCRQLVEEAQSSAEVHRAIGLELAAELSSAVGDENLLRHIIANLLSNALKYSPPASPVTFSVQRDGECAIFRISDRGIGIPADDLRNIFKAFHRGRNVGARPGTGLGLVVVHSFVQHHSGDIDIASEVGIGTTVIVRLPLFGRFTPVARIRSLTLDPSAPVSNTSE